ncbi:hypothetical protein [Bauldia litoralis]|uniref:Uncharacterized protein n=1 Tax=Bauldia litoralis TaxID=665467 RepID=A0A1G6EQC2_9HYPH|nr:hypothetical protein [Bauldia litoralis]SDB59482.1 hypothetical protein SAMN02982931_04805 [Bauldia litoralis]
MPKKNSSRPKAAPELSPRQRLLKAALDGDSTPAQAEAEASRLGVSPLLDRPDSDAFDPMREDRWTLPMTIAWIVWRAPEMVRENWHAYVIGCTRWRGVFRNGTCIGFEPGPLPTPTWSLLALHEDYPRERSRATPWRPRSPDEAREELWKALEHGDVEADAIDLDTGKRVAVTATAWKSLELYSELDMDIVREDPLSRSGYHDIRLPMRQVTDAWPVRVLSEVLPSPMTPDGPGYMPLSAAAQWIATKGAAVDVGLNPEAWDEAYRQLTDRIASAEVACTGISKRGQRERLEPALLGGIRICHLFGSEEIDNADSEELYLWASPYVDEEHWRAGFSDDLRQRRQTVWTKVMVNKPDIANWWPFGHEKEIEPGPLRTGAPGAPSTMSYILAEHEIRCERGVADKSVGVEAGHLEAWFHEKHPSWPCSKKKTIENCIRERHRRYSGDPRK